jgi:DNA-directed RNA polymerase subunit RPC12/RpoP
MYKTLEMPTLECLRCGHTWIPRQPKEAKTCPKCRSPYWNKPKWKGEKEMLQQISYQLYGVLMELSAACGSAIKPHQVIFESTREESKYHFRVPNPSRKQIIGWGNLRLSRSAKFGKNQPCATVSVYAALLNDQDPEYKENYYSNANYGRLPGLIQIATCQVRDNDYKLALRALTEASKNLVAGKRYKWKEVKK